VTQAVSGGRHDGFKYFRSEARAPPCPVPCGIVEIALPFSRSFSLSLFLSLSFRISRCLRCTLRPEQADVDVSAILERQGGKRKSGARGRKKSGQGGDVDAGCGKERSSA